jgi:hypothetical protein
MEQFIEMCAIKLRRVLELVVRELAMMFASFVSTLVDILGMMILVSARNF